MAYKKEELRKEEQKGSRGPSCICKCGYRTSSTSTARYYYISVISSGREHAPNPTRSHDVGSLNRGAVSGGDSMRMARTDGLCTCMCWSSAYAAYFVGGGFGKQQKSTIAHTLI
jgi:hypothetical protein